jgi:hypothetical protein
MLPRQFGPVMRIPVRRTISTTRSCMAMPSPPSSAKPEESTCACRMPFATQSSSAFATAGAGTRTRALSATSGRSAALGQEGRPCTGLPLTLIGKIRPW